MEKCRKAKEMHAEQLLKISTNLFTAFIVTILIVPISVVASAAFHNTTTQNPLNIFINLFGSWYAVVFIAAESALYYLVFKARDNAYAIYNELYPDDEVET
ncbi:hypothetical protein J7384_16870 [Endozoicomonas sp. G2_1]|uniref:hypothetical protein n=1 Tax=Endozoicomonas sp. G2_1 TaxID=2821091 RepID=UPI001ADCDEC1|nr:hypothetical protein [Endozoicomonas sp. G2_1]MBO9492036.1 hypothetical protein [Endozoicomonas sp. G2_1]